MKAIILRHVGRFVSAAFVIGAATVAPLAIADDDYQILSRQGVVEEVDVQGNQVVIGGVRYDVALDANVEIGGSYGAFTLLQPGMSVKIMMRRDVGNGHTDIIDLKELAPGVKARQYYGEPEGSGMPTLRSLCYGHTSGSPLASSAMLS